MSNEKCFYQYPFNELVKKFGKDKSLEVIRRYKGIATGTLLYSEIPCVKFGLLMLTLPDDWENQLKM